MVTTHDIEANGKTYILQWDHSEEGDGYITITQTCDAPDEEDGHDFHETYDFEEVL